MASADSTYVAYAGRALLPGTLYQWTVATWATSASAAGAVCQSAPSAPASFITALFSGWGNGTKFIGVPGSGTAATFGYFRKEIAVPAGVVSAAAFVTAVNADPLLCGYKLYIDGALVDVGPGRGEAPVFGGDGVFRSLPYTTLDVTSLLPAGRPAVLALQAMHAGGASALMQLQLRLASGQVVTIGTDATWQAFDGDAHRAPGKPQHGSSAGTGFIEYIDARQEPVGWTLPGFKPGAGWTPASAVAPTAAQASALHSKMEPPMQVHTHVPVRYIGPFPPPPPPPTPPPPSPPATCVDAAENSVADIGCPGGSTIATIEFASFGTPMGSCQGGGKFTADPKCNSNHSLAVVSAACVGKISCQVPATCAEFHEKLMQPGAFCWDVVKSLAVVVTCNKAPRLHTPPPASTRKNSGAHARRASAVLPSHKPPNTDTGAPYANTSNTFLADFGRELQGGLRLAVEDGRAGQTVSIACGEALGHNVVTSTWGWEFTWTLRDGPQVLEQHKCAPHLPLRNPLAPSLGAMSMRLPDQWGHIR